MTITSEHIRKAGAQHTMAYLIPVLEQCVGHVSGKRILDVGCGTGFVANHLRSLGATVVGLDLSESAIRHARAIYPEIRFEVLPADDQVLANLGEAPFDLIVSTEVVEHLYDPRSYARGCFNATKPGGKIICSTPYHGYLKNLLVSMAGKFDSHVNPLWDGGHIKFWSRLTLFQLLREAGYSQMLFSGAGRVPLIWKSMVVTGIRPPALPTA